LIYSTLSKLRPIFHWAQAAPTRHRDKSHWIYVTFFLKSYHPQTSGMPTDCLHSYSDSSLEVVSVHFQPFRRSLKCAPQPKIANKLPKPRFKIQGHSRSSIYVNTH